MSDHLDERIPRGEPWPQSKPQTPHDEQPEPKEYPAPYEHGFCPFFTVYLQAPSDTWTRKLLPCDPAGCQLGIPEENRCSFKDLAATSNALYLCHANQDASNASIRQLVKELSDRLGANLQSIHSNQTRLIDLARSFDETSFTECLAGIQLMLTQIHLNLERISPPPETAQPT